MHPGQGSGARYDPAMSFVPSGLSWRRRLLSPAVIVAVALVLLVSKDQRLIVVLPAIVIIGREIAISALREWMAEIGQRRKVAVSKLGKLKTILQIVGLSMMLIRWDVWFLPTYNLGVILTAIAAVLTVLSAIDYLRAAWPDLKGRAGAP